MSEAGVPPPVSADEKTAILSMFEGGPGGDGTPSRDWFAGSSLRLGDSGRGPRLGAGSIEPDPTRDELQAAFRQSERDYRSATERSAAGAGSVAQTGDTISRMLGTSSPQAIGNFIRANRLGSSNIEAGRNYFIPDDVGAYGDAAALGQAVLNGDNQRLAALARERFDFGDGMDAKDIRLSNFSYKSRLGVELAKVDAESAYQALMNEGPSATAWDPSVGQARQASFQKIRTDIALMIGGVTTGYSAAARMAGMPDHLVDETAAHEFGAVVSLVAPLAARGRSACARRALVTTLISVPSRVRCKPLGTFAGH